VTGPPDRSSCFHDEGELVVAGRSFRGKERLSRFYGAGPTPRDGVQPTKYMISNILVDRNDDHASVISYFQVLQGSGPAAWGRYLDNIVRFGDQ
jgi:hypothetical protein